MSPLFIPDEGAGGARCNSTGDVKNMLRVEGEVSVVLFLVNGQKVAEVPRAPMAASTASSDCESART